MKVAYSAFFKSSFKDAILISEHKEKRNDSYMKMKYMYNNNQKKKSIYSKPRWRHTAGRDEVDVSSLYAV